MADSQNAGLKRTHQLLADEYNNLNEATQVVDRTADNMRKAKVTYDKYDPKIRETTRLVDEIQKKERWDEMKLKYSFNAFMYSAAYLFLKRFYLNEIIYLLLYIAYYLMQYTLQCLQSLVQRSPEWYKTGSNTQLIDYLLQSGDGDRYGLLEFAHFPV